MMRTHLLASFLLLVSCAGAAAQCPRVCICFSFNPAGTQFAVDCRGRGLRAVPKPLPPATIHLDVGDNEITQIRAGDFAGLTQLLYLHLQNNRIASIDNGSFSQLGQLQVLNLYDNRVTQFENGTFTGLGRLRQLEAYNAGLRSIEPGAFSPLRSATIVNLDQNSLVLLSKGTFDSLPLLTRLSIRNNLITAVETMAFSDLPRLAYLHLGNNRIQTVGEMAFVGVPALRVIFFDNNDFTCGCEALWLWELIRKRSALGPGPRCSRPDQLRDFSLQHLKSEDQLCPQPEVQVKISKRYIFPGDDVQLICESSGLVRPRTYWSKEGRLVSTRRDYAFEDNKLVIHNISVSHQGRYFCAASNNVDGVASSGVELFLSGLGIRAPVFDREIITRLIFEGENVVFDCDPRLDTTEGLAISWARTDALPLPEGHVITATNSLMLLNVITAHEGTYRCTATNVLGTAFLDYRLEVEIPIASRAPTIDKTNGSLLLTFARGTRGEIDCFVMSESLFTIDWFLDGWPIRDQLFETEYQLLNDGQTLVLPNADIRHAGNYMCLVTNDAGLARLQAIVEVTQLPFFRTQPSDIGVPPTKAAQFFCSGGGSPQPTVQWFHISNKTGVERQLQTSGDVFLSDERLIILHTRSSDEGIYYCKVVSPLGEMTSRQGFLTVYTPPTFTVTNLPTIVTVSEFDRVELPCTASGRPLPDVTWSKQGSLVGEVEGGRVVKLQSGTLEIGNAARDDEGEYKCRVANAAGEQFHTIRLNVTTRPAVALQPQRVIAEVGETVRFSCLASGFPMPETMWLFKARRITENDRVIVTRTGDLLITSLSPRDEGYYSCLARNAEGQAEDRALLDVVGFKGNTSEPKINDDFTSVTTVSRSESDEVTFVCLVDGVPTPTIRWQRTIGSEVVFVTPTTRVRIDDVGVLRILNLKPSDEGLYTCDAENSRGNVQQSYRLIIQKPPEILLAPLTPHIDPGDTIRLSCQADGTPNPEIEWLLDNRKILPQRADAHDSRDIIIEEGMLLITNAGPRDSGEYACLATNNAGRASHSIKIQVIENDEPRFITRPITQIAAVGADIILDCMVNGTPPITLEWQKDGQTLLSDDHVLIEKYPSGVVSVIIQMVELTDSGRYSCYTFNSFGTAEYEVEVFVTTSTACIPPEDVDGIITNRPFPSVNRSIAPPEAFPQEGLGTPVYGSDGGVQAHAGQTMHLQCTNKTNNHLNHYWLHNNSDVVIDDQRVQNMANGSLIVKRISFRDGGDYECIYTTEDPLQGVLISSYTVKVTHAPSGPSIKVQLVEFVITPENQTIIAGSTAVISCEAHYEDGLLDTGWQRGGEVLSNSSVVVIPRAAIMDGGEYVCVVANTGLKNSTFLNVHVAPIFTTRPQDATVNTSSPPVEVTFSCRAEGMPKPTYIWRKGNSSINFHSSQYQLRDDGRELVIQPPFNDGVSGRYTCIVFNSIGSVEASAMLQIINQDSGGTSETTSCTCQLKTRQRPIVVDNCVSFNQHNENYCQGFCTTTAYPAYSSADDQRHCCYPGPDSVLQLIPMRCTESGHIINKAVQVEAVRSCQCQLC